MMSVTMALLPVFVLILLGWGARRTRFLDDGFWLPAERLTYFVLFPALLIANLAEARLAGLPVAALAGAHASAILVVAGAALAGRRLLGALTGPAFTSVFQGTIRPNTYVGLAGAAGLYGAEGVVLVAVCIAVAVPLVNLLSVVVMVRHAGAAEGGRPVRWRKAVPPVLKNPLIGACVLGIGLNLSGIGLPQQAGTSLKVLGQAALPLGLLAVGAGLDLSGLRDKWRALGLSSAAKLALLPALVAGAGVALGLQGTELAVAVLYAGLPCSPSTYMLARQMGGDTEVAAHIITLQTLLAGLTLPLAVVLAVWSGW